LSPFFMESFNLRNHDAERYTLWSLTNVWQLKHLQYFVLSAESHINIAT
jgi:hypothetical protein